MVWLVKMKEMQYKIILKELFFMIYNRTIKTRSEGYEKNKNQFAYLLIIALTFYGLPLIDRESKMLMLWILFPLVCFLSAIVYGIKYLFSLVYSILVMVLFIPTIFIFYNETASFYIGVYGVISLVGNLLGSFIRKIDDRK